MAESIAAKRCSMDLDLTLARQSVYACCSMKVLVSACLAVINFVHCALEAKQPMSTQHGSKVDHFT